MAGTRTPRQVQSAISDKDDYHPVKVVLRCRPALASELQFGSNAVAAMPEHPNAVRVQVGSFPFAFRSPFRVRECWRLLTCATLRVAFSVGNRYRLLKVGRNSNPTDGTRYHIQAGLLSHVGAPSLEALRKLWGRADSFAIVTFSEGTSGHIPLSIFAKNIDQYMRHKKYVRAPQMLLKCIMCFEAPFRRQAFPAFLRLQEARGLFPPFWSVPTAPDLSVSWIDAN